MSGILGAEHKSRRFSTQGVFIALFMIHELAMKSWRIAACFDTQFHVKVA